MPNEHFIAKPLIDRRAVFQRTGGGFGLAALASILNEQNLFAAATPPVNRNLQVINPLASRASNFPASAKSVIWLFMNGGQSQVDTWDYKPALEKVDGQALKGFDKNTGFFSN